MKSNFNLPWLGAALLVLLALTGCNQSAKAPLMPLEGTTLSVSMSLDKISGSLLGAAVNEVLYQVTGPGMKPVEGVVGQIVNPASSGVINFSIPLDLGPARLMAFQLNDASNHQPLAVGAVEMDLTSQPAGLITVVMGSLLPNCYGINTGLYNAGSYFTFQSGALANAATVVSTTAFDADFLPVTVGAAVGFQLNALNSNSVAYLGNGNLVNFAQAPSSGYLASSGAAKQAAGAAVTLLQAGDVYCVNLNGAGHAWVQVANAGSATSGPSFRFRVNTTLSYYAYEQTAAERAGNCPGALPTPTGIPTSTFTSTLTATQTPTPSATHTATNSPTLTPTSSSTNSPTVTPTLTITSTPTVTATFTVTNSPTITNTPGGAVTVSGTVFFNGAGTVNPVQGLWLILEPIGGGQQADTSVYVNGAPYTMVSTAGSYNLIAFYDYASGYHGGTYPTGDPGGYYQGAGTTLACVTPVVPPVTGSVSGLAVTIGNLLCFGPGTPAITPIPTFTPTPSTTATDSPTETPTNSPTSTVTSTPTVDTPVAYWTANDIPATGAGTYPSGIAVNAAGTTVYIDFFTTTDPNIQIWTESAVGSNSYSNSGDVSIGYNGTEAGPYGLTTDSAGNVYVAAFNLNQGLELNSSLTSVIPIGSPATVAAASPGYLYGPWDIAVDGSGNVYMSDDYITNTIQTFGPSTSSFPFQNSWAANPVGGANYYEPSIAVNNAGTTIYSAPSPEIDTGVTFISLYSPSGASLGSWSGTGFANAVEPLAMAVAPAGSPYAGNLYVTDIQYNRVDEFNPSGSMVGSWGSLASPYGIAVDGQGYIYVANNVASLSPGNVLKFNPR